MNINIVNVAGVGKAVAEHCEGSTLSTTEVPDSINFVDYGIFTPVGKCVNVSEKSLRYNLMKKEFDNAVLGLEKKETVSYLFSVFNGEAFGAFMEIFNAPHFMSGGVGPKIGTGWAVGVIPEMDVYEALLKLSTIKKFLSDIDYCGEVCLGISEDFSLTSLDLGHFPAFFAMFAETSKFSVENIIRFCVGEEKSNESYPKDVVVCGMISLPSFPSYFGQKEKIRAVRGAEKHLWRLPILNVEPALLTTHGANLSHAKKRFFETTDLIRSSHAELQFRTDIGRKAKFVLSSSKWEALSGFQNRIEKAKTSYDEGQTSNAPDASTS